MRASSETYKQVAEHCSSFSLCPEKTTTTASSSAHGTDISCTTCKYFDTQKYCKLDLYDEIVRSRNLI